MTGINFTFPPAKEPRKKMGRTGETGVCLHCAKPIEFENWNDGGTIWVHSATGRAYCSQTLATPVLD